MKQFADDIFINNIGRKFSKLVENTLGQGEIARNEQFLFCPKCFQDLYCRHVKTRACFENGLTRQAMVFTCLQYKSFENTVGKGEIACDEQFLLFPQRFLPIWRTFYHFHQI